MKRECYLLIHRDFYQSNNFSNFNSNGRPYVTRSFGQIKKEKEELIKEFILIFKLGNSSQVSFEKDQNIITYDDNLEK